MAFYLARMNLNYRHGLLRIQQLQDCSRHWTVQAFLILWLVRANGQFWVEMH